MEEEKKGDKDKQNKKRKNKVLNDISRKSMLNGYKQMTRKELEQHLQTVDSTLDDPEEEEMGSNIKKLQKQLEFYFGDSNLRNDKFLRELIFENNKGYVDLSVFLKFNKVKQILGDMDVEEDKIKALVDACSTSLLLKLNKDKTKVRRKIPFTQETLIKHQEEMDRRTVYVEDIPEDTNHEAIAHVFSKCGKILHVSLPKYSESKTLKGFGFIEFSVKVFYFLIDLS
jgi:La domain./RNA recognition motif.